MKKQTKQLKSTSKDEKKNKPIKTQNKVKITGLGTIIIPKTHGLLQTS